MQIRVGIGFDVHRLVPDRKLILGGVRIPFEKGLLGHSDADVVLHAVCDAVLGALGEGDIGMHFPDSDSRYKDMDSCVLLAEMKRFLSKNKARLDWLDITVIAQRPRIAPFIPAMKSRISSVLEIRENQLNIKATTTEGLGFAGREEGIAAQAVATVELGD